MSSKDFRFRIGQGFDVHALVRGRKLMLGGVEIPFALGQTGGRFCSGMCGLKKLILWMKTSVDIDARTFQYTHDYRFI